MERASINMTLLKSLPNFFILGAAKCGTTFLYNYLKLHPQIYFPNDKECHFFDHDTFWGKGVHTYLRWYFKKAEHYLVRGEATPAYFRLPEKVIPRMLSLYADNPPKFLVVFRNPVERAWSHYRHMVRNCIENKTFERALELEKKRLNENPFGWWGYYSDGLYASQLQKWLRYFPRERFIFFITEDLHYKPNKVVMETCTFLDIDFKATFNSFDQANVASETRSKFLMNFLVKPSGIKKPFKILLPMHKRKQLKEWLQRINLKMGSNYLPRDAQIKTLGLNHLTWFYGFELDGIEYWSEVMQSLIEEMKDHVEPYFDPQTLDNLQSATHSLSTLYPLLQTQPLLDLGPQRNRDSKFHLSKQLVYQRALRRMLQAYLSSQLQMLEMKVYNSLP